MTASDIIRTIPQDTVRLQASDLSLDVPGRRLLNEVGFIVGSGECLALIGPSGSGKTSLLNCLCGINSPTSGSVRVNGVNLASLRFSERSAFRLQHIGMVFQFGELLPELSVLENVALPGRLVGLHRFDAERQASEWLNLLGLDGQSDAHPDELSGGEIQRTGIARALVHRPGLVLADEPTGALDEQNTKRIAELLAGVAKESGAAVIVATHDPLVASTADRVLRLRDGTLTEVQEFNNSVQAKP